MTIVMNKSFNLDKADKQMPYTTPDNFFDELEENIWKSVKGDYLANDAHEHHSQPLPQSIPLHHRTLKWKIVMRSIAAVAASVALAFMVHMNHSKPSTITINDVDKAYSQLSTEDQAYMLNVYQEDIFINGSF